jgi:hypothetical protein
MTETRDFTELIEQLQKTADALGLSEDQDKYYFFAEMMREHEFGLAFDTIEDFVGEQESEDMVMIAASLLRLRMAMQLPRG